MRSARTYLPKPRKTILGGPFATLQLSQAGTTAAPLSASTCARPRSRPVERWASARALALSATGEEALARVEALAPVGLQVDRREVRLRRDLGLGKARDDAVTVDALAEQNDVDEPGAHVIVVVGQGASTPSSGSSSSA